MSARTQLSPRGRRLSRWALIGLLTLIAWQILPTVPFVILAVVVLLVSAFAFSATWYERAIDVETENVSLLFAVASLEADNAELAREHEALLDRLSEVLDEHALCPVPVEEVPEKKPRATGGVVKSGTVTIIGEGRKIPAQRKGGKS